MIACTVDSADCLLSTVTAALMDLLHSYEHMAGLAAELCVMVSEFHEQIGRRVVARNCRLDTGGGSGDEERKQRKWHRSWHRLSVNPRRPTSVGPGQLVVHFAAFTEPYNMRSSIVTAVAHILTHLAKQQRQQQQQPVPNESNPMETMTCRGACRAPST
jgi:condensin complex subunit 1